MKTFQKFLEQASAVAPQPTPAKPVEKAPQTKGSPKVYDPGRGVDVDDSGRWVGKVVDTPKTKAPEQKKTTPAVTTGADPNIPAGEANPGKKKGYNDLAQNLPPGPSGYKKPGTYDPKQFYPIAPGYGKQFPSPNLPMTGPGLSKSNQDNQIAQAKPEMPSYVRDSIKRQYSGQDYKPEDAKNIINWQKKLKDA